MFHSLSNRGGWEEVQNVGYNYAAPEWHDEKQPAPTALPEISSKHKFKYTVKNLHSNPHFKKYIQIVVMFAVTPKTKQSVLKRVSEWCFGLAVYWARSNILWDVTVSFFFSTFLYLHKSCPNMTYLKVRWELEAPSSLFILIHLCCLDKFSAVLLVAAPEHKSFLFVTLISLPSFPQVSMRNVRGRGTVGGEGARGWGDRRRKKEGWASVCVCQGVYIAHIASHWFGPFGGLNMNPIIRSCLSTRFLSNWLSHID